LGDPVQVAEIAVQGDQVFVRANSDRRAGLFYKRIFELVGGDNIIDYEYLVSTYDLQMEISDNGFPTPKDSEGNSLRVFAKNARAETSDELPEEIMAEVQKHLERYLHEWLDIAIPALRNKTPREASKDKALKPLLESLLIDYEFRAKSMVANKNKGHIAITSNDIARLRAQRGMTTGQ